MNSSSTNTASMEIVIQSPINNRRTWDKRINRSEDHTNNKNNSFTQPSK